MTHTKQVKKMRDPELEYAYQMGRDCALNGPNNVNCNFAIFSTQEKAEAWSEGRGEEPPKKPPYQSK